MNLQTENIATRGLRGYTSQQELEFSPISIDQMEQRAKNLLLPCLSIKKVGIHSGELCNSHERFYGRKFFNSTFAKLSP